jgi:hypothetical protein
MEFLKGETEARYAWDTAATFAWREARLRAAAPPRPIQAMPTMNVVKDYRTIREALRATQPASVQGRFTPPFGWNSAHAAMMAAAGHPDYSEEAYRRAFTVSSAHQLHLALSGRN